MMTYLLGGLRDLRDLDTSLTVSKIFETFGSIPPHGRPDVNISFPLSLCNSRRINQSQETLKQITFTMEGFTGYAPETQEDTRIQLTNAKS